MKSKHLAKADFLRRLASHAESLYELGDFTCTKRTDRPCHPKQRGSQMRNNLGGCNPEEVQSVIDKAHMQSLASHERAVELDYSKRRPIK